MPENTAAACYYVYDQESYDRGATWETFDNDFDPQETPEDAALLALSSLVDFIASSRDLFVDSDLDFRTLVVEASDWSRATSPDAVPMSTFSFTHRR